MSRYLVFTLHGTLSAFGSVAAGERRPSWDRPARSAVFGLLAGALGIDRDNEAAHLKLNDGYGMAVRTDAVGLDMPDYHTVQAPSSSARGPKFHTRADELSRVARWDLNTVLTQRYYRNDALHLVAIWRRDNGIGPYELEALADALVAPVYVPYIGRKCCPLSLPLAPLVVDADDVRAAFNARVAAAAEPELHLRRVLCAKVGVVAMDAEAADKSSVARIEQRRDHLASRKRWQFSLRPEAILRPVQTKDNV